MLSSLYHWLRDNKLEWISQLLELDGTTVRSSIREKAKHLPALQHVIKNLSPTTTTRPTLGNYTSPAVSGFYRVGHASGQHRRNAKIIEIDQFENDIDPSEPDHLASISGWVYLQDTDKPHEDIYYVKEYITFNLSTRYLIPIDATASSGSHNLLDPDTDQSTHGSDFYTKHRHTQLKLNLISRASQRLEDAWASSGRPWTTPGHYKTDSRAQRISPFGADAYEDPSKCDHELNPDTPHVHTLTGGDLSRSRDTTPITVEDIETEAFTDSDTGDDRKTLDIFSDASVIDGGRKGAGAWRVRGGSVSRGLRVYPVDRPLSSTRAELITALNCIFSVRKAYYGKLRLFIDNKTVVDRLNGMDITRKARFWGKDADLWCCAHKFLCRGTRKADCTFRWVESHVDTKTDKLGNPRVPNSDELQNIAVDKEAAKAYAIPEANHDSPTADLTMSHMNSQTATIRIMGQPVTGPLNEAMSTHIRMELYHQYQDSRGQHDWSKGLDHTLRYKAHRAAPFKSKHSRTHGHRTTTNYRLYNDKYTTLGVKARRAGETVEQPCPWCLKDTENTAHIISRCRQPTVVQARRLFLNKQLYAIGRAKLTKSTRKALSALYSTQRDGTMATLKYPSDTETTQIVNTIIEECGQSQEPLRDFYCRLWEMDATDRALSWIRRDWIFELTKVPGNTVEGAEDLAIKLIQNSSNAHEIWRARCAALRELPDGDPVERRQAMIQYETELRRTRRKTMPVPRDLFLKKSWHQRQRLLRGWTNLPSVEVTALRDWLNGTPSPEPDPPPAPQHQSAQTRNPPTPTNNAPPTPPLRRPTINKRLPQSTPNIDQHRITSFFTRTPQARAPPRPAVPPPPPQLFPENDSHRQPANARPPRPRP